MIKPNVYFIVDDDDDDRILLEEALKLVDESSVCFMCDNGEDGLKKIRAGVLPRPDYIFVDLNMPKLNGRQFLFQIINDHLFQEIPVIIYTTSYFLTEVDELFKLGAACFIQKPSDFNRLLVLLKDCLDEIDFKKKDVNLPEQFA